MIHDIYWFPMNFQVEFKLLVLIYKPRMVQDLAIGEINSLNDILPHLRSAEVPDLAQYKQDKRRADGKLFFLYGILSVGT